MSKILKPILIFLTVFVLYGCSFDNKTNIWKNPNKQKSANVELIKLSHEQKKFQEEINLEKIIEFESQEKKNDKWIMSGLNYLNAVNHLKFDGNINNSSKLNFKKIQHNKIKENPLVVTENYFITIDSKGSILKFTNKDRLQWSKNIYNKREKRKIEGISLAIFENKLFAIDNLGKYYALDINTGELIWSNQNDGVFNSQLKIFDNKIFAVDSNNVIYCFSTLDGKLIWKFRTQSTFIKTNKKISLILIGDSVIFSNSAGDITKININDGKLNWLIPTQNTLLRHETNFLETSDIVLIGNNLFFSNNFTNFYSLNVNTGVFNWIKNINSTLRPIVIDNYLFTISQEGYLITIDATEGTIIRSKYILDKFSSKQKEELSFQGFLIASNKIYITTSIGYLIICSVNTGKLEKIIKISSSNLSEPLISNNNLYILTNKSVVIFK